MKKLMTTIGLGLIMASVTPVMAQSKNQDNPKKNEAKKMTTEEKAQKITDRMTKELGLSEDQAKKVYTVNLKHVKEMEIIRTEMKKLKAKAKSQRENTKKEMDKILTDEQKTKAEELHQKRKEKMKEKHKGQGPHGEGEHDKE